MARPSKLTPKTRQVVLDAIAFGAPLATACAAAGVSVRSVNEWRQIGERRHPTKSPSPEHIEFAEAVNRAIADAELVLLKRVYEASKDDYRAAGVPM